MKNNITIASINSLIPQTQSQSLSQLMLIAAGILRIKPIIASYVVAFLLGTLNSPLFTNTSSIAICGVNNAKNSAK